MVKGPQTLMLLHMAHKPRNLPRNHIPLVAISPVLSKAPSSLDSRPMVKAQSRPPARLLQANLTKCCCSLTWLPSNSLLRSRPVAGIAGTHSKVSCKNGRSRQRVAASRMCRSRRTRAEANKTSRLFWTKRRENCLQRMESL